MAVESIPTTYKNSISKWSRVKIKKIKNPFKPWKTKKVRTQKFDAGKAAATWHYLIDKINALIVYTTNFKTEQQIRNIILEYNYVTLPTAAQLIINDIAEHNNQQIAYNSSAHNPSYQSDRRLKTDIKFIGTSPSGINIYRFKFTDSNKYSGYGNDLYQGVLSDEVPESVVTKDENGYDMVDYNKIDVDFVKVNKL